VELLFYSKAVYISPLATAGIILLADLYNYRSKKAWKNLVIQVFWIAIGVLLILLPVGLYFWQTGNLDRLLMVFTIGKNYVAFRTSASTLSIAILYPLIGLTITNSIIIIFCLAGIFSLVLHKLRRKLDKPELFIILVWFIFSYIEASITLTYFTHYFLLLIPPVAILAAWFMVIFYDSVTQKFKIYSKISYTFVLSLLISMTLIPNIQTNYIYYQSYVRYKQGSDTYESFTLRHGAITAQRLADYVTERTKPEDFIYYWSGNTQFYYLADRLCPIDIIWPIYADATGPYDRIFIPQTKYIILGESNNIPRPQWLYEEVAENYTYETVIDEQYVYRRIEY
jgi:hypothetical protein